MTLYVYIYIYIWIQVEALEELGQCTNVDNGSDPGHIGWWLSLLPANSTRPIPTWQGAAKTFFLAAKWNLDESHFLLGGEVLRRVLPIAVTKTSRRKRNRRRTRRSRRRKSRTNRRTRRRRHVDTWGFRKKPSNERKVLPPLFLDLAFTKTLPQETTGSIFIRQYAASNYGVVSATLSNVWPKNDEFVSVSAFYFSLSHIELLRRCRLILECHANVFLSIHWLMDWAWNIKCIHVCYWSNAMRQKWTKNCLSVFRISTVRLFSLSLEDEWESFTHKIINEILLTSEVIPLSPNERTLNKRFYCCKRLLPL